MVNWVDFEALKQSKSHTTSNFKLQNLTLLLNDTIKGDLEILNIDSDQKYDHDQASLAVFCDHKEYKVMNTFQASDDLFYNDSPNLPWVVLDNEIKAFNVSIE